MLVVPKALVQLRTTGAPRCTTRVWQPGQVLLVGALLAPGQRPITAVWRCARGGGVAARWPPRSGA
jgi:hypothetical protein